MRVISGLYMIPSLINVLYITKLTDVYVAVMTDLQAYVTVMTYTCTRQIGDQMNRYAQYIYRCVVYNISSLSLENVIDSQSY